MTNNKEKKKIQVCVKLTESQFIEFTEMAEKTNRTLADFIRVATMKYIAIKKESDEL